MKKPTQEFVPCGGKVCARRLSIELVNRMNPRYKHDIWLGVRNNSQKCCILTKEGLLRVREIRRLERHHRRDKETINSTIGVLWRLVFGRWSVAKDQRPELIQYRHCRHRSLELVYKANESPSNMLMLSAQKCDVRISMRSGPAEEHKHIPIVADVELQNTYEKHHRDQC